MDRLFLDANVLFSAAYRSDAGLRKLWSHANAELCTSRYALEEARFNLSEETQRRRLTKLAMNLRFFEAVPRELPTGIRLPEKDVPILLAAMQAQATHLITGDVHHFGAYFGKHVAGVLISSPGEYLRKI
ncbi:MAG TPA: PIN domain-containing protein [Candidatus Dormibacteraeota bacterium]|nr:PIN domain-containing protein [Candidatus Dormibacteraeota bacterium]